MVGHVFLQTRGKEEGEYEDERSFKVERVRSLENCL